ncbi:hypothetical protein TNCV_3867231 [Trichonephila clavipes]|nr:hypothetical protein TNCV_3867231 [Trichonephila clavipes]
MVRVVCSLEPKPVLAYPFGSWGEHSGDRGPYKLDLNRFNGYKFRSSSAKVARRSLAPRARNKLKSTLAQTHYFGRDLGIAPVREVLKKQHEDKQ